MAARTTTPVLESPTPAGRQIAVGNVVQQSEVDAALPSYPRRTNETSKLGIHYVSCWQRWRDRLARTYRKVRVMGWNQLRKAQFAFCLDPSLVDFQAPFLYCICVVHFFFFSQKA